MSLTVLCIEKGCTVKESLSKLANRIFDPQFILIIAASTNATYTACGLPVENDSAMLIATPAAFGRSHKPACGVQWPFVRQPYAYYLIYLNSSSENTPGIY
jgi:hypothetical protein